MVDPSRYAMLRVDGASLGSLAGYAFLEIASGVSFGRSRQALLPRPRTGQSAHQMPRGGGEGEGVQLRSTKVVRREARRRRRRGTLAPPGASLFLPASSPHALKVFPGEDYVKHYSLMVQLALKDSLRKDASFFTVVSPSACASVVHFLGLQRCSPHVRGALVVLGFVERHRKLSCLVPTVSCPESGVGALSPAAWPSFSMTPVLPRSYTLAKRERCSPTSC